MRCRICDARLTQGECFKLEASDWLCNECLGVINEDIRDFEEDHNIINLDIEEMEED